MAPSVTRVGCAPGMPRPAQQFPRLESVHRPAHHQVQTVAYARFEPGWHVFPREFCLNHL